MKEFEKLNYLWKQLPAIFTLREAVNLTQNELLPLTTIRLIKKNTELFERVKRGLYKKKDVDFLKELSKMYEG